MSNTIFGIKVLLNDFAAPVTENTDIGLYRITATLAAAATAGLKEFAVMSIIDLEQNRIVRIVDSANRSEISYIKSIAGNNVLLKNELAQSYTNSPRMDGNSEFRWVQNAVTGISQRWKTGMLVHNGIGEFSKTIDLSKGGNIASDGESEVTIKNTQQFFNTLKAWSIYLNGLDADIYKFTDTTKARQWSGICEKPSWNTMEYRIPLFGKLNKRRSNITKYINKKDYPNASDDIISKSIPVTFGELSRAKFLITSDAENVFTLANLITLSASGDADLIELELSNYDDRIGDTIFPIISNDGSAPPRVYKFQFANNASGVTWKKNTIIQDTGVLALNWFVGKYLHVVEGDGEGEYRYISAAEVDMGPGAGTSCLYITITVSNYYTTTLAGNSTAKAKRQSWIEVTAISKQYQSDTWPMRAVLDSDGNEVQSGFELAAYDDNKKVKVTTDDIDGLPIPIEDIKKQFYNIPAYAFSKSTINNDNNVLNIDLNQFKDDKNNIESFTILAIKNFSLYDAATLDALNSDPSDVWDTYVKLEDGLYHKSGWDFDSGYTWTKTNPVGYISDRIYSTSYILSLATPYSASNDAVKYAYAFSIKLPDIDESMVFDSVHLLVDIDTKNDLYGSSPAYYDSSAHVRFCRIAGYAQEIISKTDGQKYTDLEAYAYLRCMPDEYYNAVIDNNVSFYYENDLSAPTNAINGHMRYQLPGIENYKQYKSIKRCLIVFWRDIQAKQVVDDKIRIHEIAVGFKKKYLIKDAVYVNTKGRIFNDTWGNRKIAATMMSNPVDILEHVCRLQNWSENTLCPSLGWGATYAANALIATGSGMTGSFESTASEFTPVLNLAAATQILKFEDAYTDKLKRTLCSNFSLANWTNAEGYECVARTKKKAVTPSDVLTLANMIDRKAITIDEPHPKDIFCEPYVRYRKNSASGEYQSIISIKNVSHSTYSSEYIEAPTGVFSGSEAQEYWDRCRGLFLKCKCISKPPENLTDLIWMDGEESASDYAAKEYLRNWIDWMYNPTIEFKAHINRVGEWEEMHPFVIQLPHQTNNLQIECLLTSIKVNPNAPYDCTIRAIMYSESIPEGFFIQDVINILTGDDAWQDVIGDSGEENIQDII